MPKGWYRWDDELSDDENVAKALGCSIADLQVPISWIDPIESRWFFIKEVLKCITKRTASRG